MSNTCVTVQLLPRQKIILIHKYNVQTYEESVASIHHDINENIPEFFLKLRSVHDLRDVKAISFMFIDAANFSSFMDAYNFRKKCQSFCKKNGIFYHFTTAATIKNSSALSSTKTMVNEDEQIAILEITSAGEVAGTMVIRGKYCYDVYQILSPKEPVFTQEWKRLFFGISNPKKVILLKEMNNVVTENLYEQLEELFKGVTPVIVVDWKDHCETFRRVTAEHAQHSLLKWISCYAFPG
uniref:Uncharacterized protein n=1 Tax=Panagrolaimus superbus TaxID=310955 RepID=A0A914YCU5_9BILA